MNNFILFKKYALLFLCVTFSAFAMDEKPLELIKDKKGYSCSQCFWRVALPRALEQELATLRAEAPALKQQVAVFLKEKADCDTNLKALQLKYHQASEDVGNSASPRKKVPESAVNNWHQKNKTLAEENNGLLVQLARLQAERGSSNKEIEDLKLKVSALEGQSEVKEALVAEQKRLIEEKEVLVQDGIKYLSARNKKIEGLKAHLGIEQKQVITIGQERNKFDSELKAMMWQRNAYRIVFFASIAGILGYFLNNKYMEIYC